MRLRFHTTRSDIFWALVYRALFSGVGIVTFLAIWIWSTYSTAEKVIEADLGGLATGIALALVGIFWAVFLVGLTLVVCGLSVLFAKKDGLICVHTLHLRDEGLEEETDVNVSLQRYSMIKGMKKRFGFWVVLVPNGIAFLFKPARIVEGDPVEFARVLNEKRG